MSRGSLSREGNFFGNFTGIVWGGMFGERCPGETVRGKCPAGIIGGETSRGRGNVEIPMYDYKYTSSGYDFCRPG